MEFLHKKNEIRLQEDGEQIGEITFREQDANKWLVTHTYIEPDHREQGLAERLVEELIERAKDEKKKIIKNAGCPYVINLFERKPDKYNHMTVTK